jgi:hypothetical protein
MEKKSTVTTDAVRVLVYLKPELAAKVDESRVTKTETRTRGAEIARRLAKSYGIKGYETRAKGKPPKRKK